MTNLTPAPEKSEIRPEVPELLRAENLRFTYGDENQDLVRDLNVTIRGGDRIALIGASGCGKTTLLRLLNGLLRPDGGQLYFKGEPVYQRNKTNIPLYRHVGLVFQHPEQQLFTQTVWNEVCFGPRNLSFSADRTKQTARHALNLVSLDESFDTRHPLALSGGEQRRVALAATLSMEHELFLLDEPGAGLDRHAKNRLFTLMRDLTKTNERALVFITHQMDDVLRVANKVWFLQEGTLKEFEVRP